MRIDRSWPGFATLLVALAVAACGSQGSANEAEGTASTGEASSDAPARMTVASGTSISVTLDEQLSTRDNRKGDGFTATVSEPVTDGSRVLIPTGATIRGKVTALQKAEGDRPAVLKMDFESIEVRGESRPLTATLVSADIETDKEMKGEAKKIGGGAAAGGLVGGILGKDAKGALIGAAVGSAAGTAITLATREEHAVLPAGTPMQVRLDQAVRVRI
jgi:carbonic anhydrase/acetyltransferase-like protein (isoleucine patch superfamily)